MQNDEILIVQNYLRQTFSNDEIQIRKQIIKPKTKTAHKT